MLKDPIVLGAVNAAIIAFLLWVQSYFQERRRKLETESAREKQAEANATRVVEKLTGTSAPITPLPPIEERVTPKESPAAKGETT